MSDGRSYVIHQSTETIIGEINEKISRDRRFIRIQAIDGRNVYINIDYIVSVTDYNYPAEDFSYFDDKDDKQKMVEKKSYSNSSEQKQEKEDYNKKAAEQFKKEIDNME